MNVTIKISKGNPNHNNTTKKKTNRSYSSTRSFIFNRAQGRICINLFFNREHTFF